MKKWILIISILVNIVFGIGWFLQWFNSPSYKLGRLEKDLQIGIFSTDSVIFRIPKGLTVRNISARGLSAIGQFENERFEIVITSEDETLVNYNLPIDSLAGDANYYSADVKRDDK